jgi:hypothetical protein
MEKHFETHDFEVLIGAARVTGETFAMNIAEVSKTEGFELAKVQNSLVLKRFPGWKDDGGGNTGIGLGGLQVRQQDNTFGLGDVMLIPGVLYCNRGNLHFALAEYIVTPTGKYDTDDLANTGLNYWTLDTDAAVTYINEEN